MSTDWHWEVGETHTREERMKLYGGGKQSGICPSAKTLNVIVYSDPEEGEKFGYKFDGWATDADVFLYTGEGQEGPQSPSSVGNKALLEHKTDGRAIRLNVAHGIVPGTNKTKLHKYIGEFEVDDEYPFFWETAPDKQKLPRQVIVFRLIPITSEPPLSGPQSGLEDKGAVLPKQIPLESSNTVAFPVGVSDGGTAERKEQQLVERCARYLNNRNYETTRWKIPIPGQRAPMYTDLYIEKLSELIEAKASCDRSDMRMAVGQLLDYRRHFEVQSLTVLVPCVPSDDLRDYLESCGIGLLMELEDGSFRRGRDL
jgi:hypothetical protein